MRTRPAVDDLRGNSVKIRTALFKPRSDAIGGLLAAIDNDPQLIICFGAPEFGATPDPLLAIRRAHPGAALLGCSTSGEIFGTEIGDGGIAVAALHFDHTTVRAVSARIGSPADSHAAGVQMAQALRAPDLRAILVLSDGLNVNGSALVRGFSGHIDESVVVAGGLAGDGDRFQKTWVLNDGTPVAGYVTAVGLYGARVRVGCGSSGGWDIFGSERRVTRSRDNVLYELDGKPALQIYKTYLGPRAADLPSSALLFPLALRASRDEPKSLVRTILAVSEADQSMTFAGDVPEGFLAQLMRANFDRLVDAASSAAGEAEHAAPATGEALCLAISCVGRRLVLGERCEDETEAVLEGLPAGTQQIGFYSYGEISSDKGGSCDLHNQTMTVTLISES
jgi:hypothetical protein